MTKMLTIRQSQKDWSGDWGWEFLREEEPISGLPWMMFYPGPRSTMGGAMDYAKRLPYFQRLGLAGVVVVNA